MFIKLIVRNKDNDVWITLNSVGSDTSFFNLIEILSWDKQNIATDAQLGLCSFVLKVMDGFEKFYKMNMGKFGKLSAMLKMTVQDTCCKRWAQQKQEDKLHGVERMLKVPTPQNH